MLHTTDRMAARRVGIQPYLDHFSDELRGVLMVTLGQNSAPHRQLEELVKGVSPALQTELDSLWESRSWKMFRGLRNLHRRRNGLGNETKPTPTTDQDAAKTIITIRHSLSWELTSFVRIIDRTIHPGRNK
jgi:hypothetical protein